LCAWIILTLGRTKQRGHAMRSEATEATGKRADVSDGRQATQWLWGRRGTFPLGPHVSCVPVVLRRYRPSLPFRRLLLFLSFLCFILPAFLWSSRAPAFYTFALTPQWHSSFLQAGSLKSTSLCVPVATFYPNSSLLSHFSSHPNKTPLTTSTPRLAGLRNGQFHLARTRSLRLDHGLRL
jgi:hypothetical protein